MGKKFDKEAHAENKAAEIDALLLRLKDGIARMQETDVFRAWAKLAARLGSKKPYSFSNYVLIFIQQSDATMLRGYKEWQELGRQVRKGGKGLWIRHPNFKKYKDDDGNEQVAKHFGYCKVFDISQTDVIEGGGWVDMPDVPMVINGECDPSLFDTLADWARSEGFTVSTDAKRYQGNGTHGGFFRPSEKLIYIKPDSPVNMVRCLVHELGHALDDTKHTYAEGEAIADGVSYIVNMQLGIDTGESTIPYIATWLGEKDGEKVLKQHMKTIVEIANKIMGALEGAPINTENDVLTIAA
jgi:antirestriction protein ArdC